MKKMLNWKAKVLSAAVATVLMLNTNVIPLSSVFALDDGYSNAPPGEEEKLQSGTVQLNNSEKPPLNVDEIEIPSVGKNPYDVEVSIDPYPVYNEEAFRLYGGHMSELVNFISTYGIHSKTPDGYSQYFTAAITPWFTYVDHKFMDGLSGSLPFREGKENKLHSELVLTDQVIMVDLAQRKTMDDSEIGGFKDIYSSYIEDRYHINKSQTYIRIGATLLSGEGRIDVYTESKSYRVKDLVNDGEPVHLYVDVPLTELDLSTRAYIASHGDNGIVTDIYITLIDDQSPSLKSAKLDMTVDEATDKAELSVEMQFNEGLRFATLDVENSLDNMWIELELTELENGKRSTARLYLAEFDESGRMVFRGDIGLYHYKNFRVNRISKVNLCRQNREIARGFIDLADEYMASAYHTIDYDNRIIDDFDHIFTYYFNATAITDNAGNKINEDSIVNWQFGNQKFTSNTIEASEVRLFNDITLKNNEAVAKGAKVEAELTDMFVGPNRSLTAYVYMKQELTDEEAAALSVTLNLLDKNGEPIKAYATSWGQYKVDELYSHGSTSGTLVRFEDIRLEAGTTFDESSDGSTVRIVGMDIDVSDRTAYPYLPESVTDIYADFDSPIVTLEKFASYTNTEESDEEESDGEYYRVSVKIGVKDADHLERYADLIGSKMFVRLGAGIENDASVRYVFGSDPTPPESLDGYTGSGTLSNGGYLEVGSETLLNSFTESYLHLLFPTEGVYLDDLFVNVLVEDVLGNRSETDPTGIIDYKVDSVAPSIRFEYRNAKVIDGNTKIEMKIGVSSTDGSDVVQLLYSWGESPEDWTPIVFERGMHAEGEITRVFGTELPESDTVYEETLWIKSVDEYGNESKPASMPVALSLQKPHTSMRFEGDYNAVSREHSVIVKGPESSSFNDEDAFTRVSVTPIVHGNQSAVTSYVTLVKTGEEVDVLKFTGLTWYKVTRVGDSYVYVSEPEKIEEDYVLSKDSIMHDLFTYYGEIKISFENGYGDMTPMQGRAVYESASDGSYYDDPDYLTLRFASVYDTDRVIHSVDFGAIINRDDNVVVPDADKGADPYLYNQDTKGVNPMRNTQIHFDLSNASREDFGMLDLDLEGSYAELYRVGENGESDVLISRMNGFAASNSQYFTIFNVSDSGEYFVSGAYYLKVTVKSRGGHLDVYESSRIVLDAETAENSGIWQYSLQNFNTLDAIVKGEYSWSNHFSEEKPFENIGVSVTVGGEILRNRMFAVYSYGSTGISLILEAPDSEKTYEGITVGKVVGYRIWNLLSEPTKEELDAEGFRRESLGDYLSVINGLSEIYTEENIPKGAAGFEELHLIKGVNTVCYQVLMENGYVSPIRQFNITVSEYTPELNVAIDSYQHSHMQSSNENILNVDHIRYFIESAYSLNGSGNVDVEVWSDYGMNVGTVDGDGIFRRFIDDPTEDRIGELGLLDIPGGLKVGDYVELTENSYTSDFPRYTHLCTAVFIARDEYGGVTIVAPQIGDERRIEVSGGIYGWEVYNIDYYSGYYDDPYLIDDDFLTWRNIYNQPLYFGKQFLGFESYVEKNNETGGEKYRQITNGSASLEYNLFNIVTNDISWGRPDISSEYYDFSDPYYRNYASISYGGGENYELIYWDGATVTFSGGDLGDESITLDLKSGDEIRSVETETGIEQVFIPNTVGYLGATVYVDNYGTTRFSLSIAHIKATAENPAGTKVTRKYVINCFSKYGDEYVIEGYVDLYYVDYQTKVTMNSYGAELELSFMSREFGDTYRSGNFNSGDYSISMTDYYGNELNISYEIEKSFDIFTNVILSDFENTPDPITVTLQRLDGGAIYVDITDYEIMSVENNGTDNVTVTLTDNTDFSYRYVDPQSGDEVVKIISVENIKKPAPKIVWDYSSNTVLVDDDGNPYKYGEVTAYLVDDYYTLIDKFSGKAPSYTFTPDGNGEHLFKGDEILATMGEYEVTLDDDYFAVLEITLREYPDPLGLDAEDTETPNVQILAYIDQNGYYFNSKLAIRLESASNTSDLPKYLDYITYEIMGERANASRLLTAVGWGTAFRFEIQTEDSSRVKIFIKEGLYAEAPDYETGYSDVIPGIELNSKLLTVSANAAFSLFVVDSSNNAASIAFDINNIGEAPAPTVVKVEKGLGTVRGYLLPPEGATNFEIVGGQNVKIDSDSPTDSRYFGKYYVEYTENDDYTVNYRFTYNEKTVNGNIRVSVTEIRLDEIALIDTYQPVWSDNKAYEATASDVIATATFTKEISEIKIAGEYDKEKVSFFISGNTLTATYSDNHPAVEIYCYDAAGNHVTVRFDAVENIDLSAPVISEVSRVLSANGRALTVTFSSNERALFKEGGYIGEMVTDEGGNTLYYYTRTIVQNGEYTYSFADMSGLITSFRIIVDEIVSEPLGVQFSTSFEGTDPTDDPSDLDVMIGDKIFVRPNRDATVEMTGGLAVEIKAGIWNEITVPDAVGGILPYIIITDAYGDVLTCQFSTIKVPDTAPPEIIVNKKTYSVKIGAAREEIEAELLQNFVAFDDSGANVTLSVKFTENIDVIGVTEVEYIATDEAGNSASVKEKLRITSIYEPIVTYGETKLYRGEGTIVSADEELIMSIDCGGAPYSVRIKAGNRTEAQMKDGSDIVTDYTTEREISFGKLEKGIYTVCIITQERDYFKIIISVE